MKKTEELKKAIRRLIKEEVKIAVSEEVNKAMGKILVEMVKEIKSDNSSLSIVNEQYKNNEEPEIPIIKTNNPKLNSVLSETARNFKPLPKTNNSSDLMTLMSGDFEKVGKDENINLEKPSTKLDFLKQMVGQSSPLNQPSALDGGSEVPDILKKVFKKDFREVMKRIDEKKKSGGGLIDPTKVLSG